MKATLVMGQHLAGELYPRLTAVSASNWAEERKCDSSKASTFQHLVNSAQRMFLTTHLVKIQFKTEINVTHFNLEPMLEPLVTHVCGHIFENMNISRFLGV